MRIRLDIDEHEFGVLFYMLSFALMSYERADIHYQAGATKKIINQMSSQVDMSLLIPLKDSINHSAIIYADELETNYQAIQKLKTKREN